MGKENYWYKCMRIIALVLSDIIFIIWIYLYLSNMEIKEDLTFEINKLSLIIVTPGLSLINIFNIRNSKKALEIEKQLMEISNSIDPKLLYIIVESYKVSLVLIIIFFGLFIYSITDIYQIVILFIFLAILFPKYIDEEIRIKYRERRKNILKYLPSLITRLSILIDSGMVIRDALDELKIAGDSEIYMLIREAQRMMDNGNNFNESILYIYQKRKIYEVKKFVNILIQSIEKGTNSSIPLKELRDDIKRDRLMNVRIESSKINEKLIIPNIIIFIGILVLILLPAFMSF